MTAHTRTHTFLGSFAIIAILLTGCGATPDSDNGRQSSTPTASDPSPDPSGSASTDAVAEYVACLREHGLAGAVVTPDGSVGYAFDEDDLDDSGVASVASGDTAAVEAACLEEVPGYTHPNENER